MLFGYWNTRDVCFHYASHVPGNVPHSVLIPLYTK